MKILTRYILKQFLWPFLFSMLLFCVIILIVTVFDQLKFIMDNKAGPVLAAKYFLLQLPYLLLQITPLAVLFGVLFSLGSFSKGSELIAMRAGGVNIFMVALPLVGAGFLVFLLSILFNETLVPKAKSLSERVRQVEIEKKPATKATQRWHISLRGEDNRMYHVERFDGPTNTMSNILILEFGQGIELASRLDAREGKWENGRWVFIDGWFRTFNADGDEALTQPFSRMPLVLPEKPDDFLSEQKEPRELNMIQLIAYIRQLQKNGADVQKELVELHLKVAFPFACVVLVLLGVPTGWKLGKWSSMATSVGLCLVVSFGYVGLIQVGQALGQTGVLSPAFAGWMANGLFLVIGGWLLVRADR